MGNLAITYQYIADILSFKSSNDMLEETLSDKEFDWDNIVIEGSKHLVLPAIYCRLKAKQLTHLLPDELDIYLKEITALNAQRNHEIISQVNSLSELLNTHEIEHVFLKGSALISGGYYDDNAERMLGDIDILVANDQLDLAFEILKKNSYYPIEQTLGNDFFEHKHLPRLKTDKYICAVELHRKLFVSHTNKALSCSNILSSSQLINTIAIPSSKHLLLHNILNYQINDNGSLYNSVSFRSAYDSLVILQRKDCSTINSNSKLIRNYFNLLGIFFKDIPEKYSGTNFATKFYNFKLKHLKFYKFWNKLIKLIDFLWIIISRIPHFIKNKAYRTALLKDRRRIFSHMRSVLKNT
jgi:hypothetical protein